MSQHISNNMKNAQKRSTYIHGTLQNYQTLPKIIAIPSYFFVRASCLSHCLDLYLSLLCPLSQNIKNEHKQVLYKSGGLLSEIRESSTNGAGVRMKHHKPTDPATAVYCETSLPRVYERSCARPGRQSAGTCPFSPNQHKILRLWQQNLLAFPWSPTNGLLTLQPWNGQIKGRKTFQKTFFCHFQWRLLYNSSTEVSSPSLKPQKTNAEILDRPAK